MKSDWVGRFGIAALMAVLAAGCAPQPSPGAPTPFATGTPTPKPTATPPRVAAQAVGVSVTLFGKNGEKVATLKAETAGFDPTNSQKTLTVSKANATLYDKEKPNVPASEMTADAVTADREKRILTATGNATVRSLTERGTPTIRADRMVWSFDNRTIQGDGNVLIATDTGITVPGRAFSADARLRTFHLENDGRPATGAAQ